MSNRYSPHLFLAHDLWSKHLNRGDCAVDATCGNGHDTVALSKLLSDGLVIGLDIQPEALSQTQDLLKKELTQGQVLLQRICHSKIHEVPLPQAPRLIVYNLGYLPGGDKGTTTKTATTLQSLAQAIFLLADDGALSITCYPGHPEGAVEELAVVEWARKLPADRWKVCYHAWINRPASPTFLWIARHP